MLTQVPPHSDASPPDIKDGYWFSLAPAFPVTAVVRDFPFGVEPTGKPAFHALTFVDLVGKDGGLLLLHPGTQYFRREERGDKRGAVSNLVMREWESHFTREYGWPIYAEYRHALLPHGGELTNADRLRSAAAFTRPLLCRVGPPDRGDLPLTKSFLSASPSGAYVSAFLRKPGGRLELRVVEVEGRPAEAVITLNLPASKAVETNLLGAKLSDAPFKDGQLRFPLAPWKIRTFEVT
jgi:hypothetical protein